MTALELSAHVRAAQNGDERAFARLVERYQNAAASVAMAIVKNAATSQDIAQAAFVAAWRKLKTLRQPESFGPWLLQLVRNEALQSLRANKRSSARDQAFQAVLPESGPSADALLAERTMYANLYAALEEIPDDCREILLLYYREGRSSEQVGELLSLSSAAVRKRLERAREVLRDRFESIEVAAKKSAPPAGFAMLVLAAMRSEAVGAAAGSIFAGKTLAAVGAAVVLIVSAVFLWPSSDAPSPPPAVAASKSKRARVALDAAKVNAAPVAAQTWVRTDDDVFTRAPLSSLPSFAVSGRVVTERGDGVEGALVSFSLEDGAKRFVTDARGEFNGSVPRGVYRVTAVANDLSAARPQLFVNADTSVELTLRAPARIDGLVRDENGKPMRAHVAISTHEHNGDFTQIESGEDGTFSLVGLAPGSYDVAAWTDDRTQSPVESGATLAQGGSYFCELSFRAATKPSVRLIDDAGAPLAGYVVEVGHEQTLMSVVSKPDGSVELTRAIPLGRVRVSVFEPGEDTELDRTRGFHTTRMVWSDGVKNDGKAIEIVVPRFGELRITAVGLDARYLHMNRIESNGGWVPELSRVVAFDAAHKAVARVPAGIWHLVPSNDLFDASSPKPMPVKVKAGRVEELNFTTKPSVEHVVRIVEANGQPARGAVIASEHQTWTADANGVVDDLSPPAYPFTASATIGGRVGVFTIASDAQREISVTLEPSASVRGVVEDVDPSEPIMVSISGPTDLWFMERAPLRFQGGAFELDDVRAGSVRVVVKTASGATGEAKVELVAGQTADVRVKLGTSAGLDGSLVITNGPPPAPLPLVTLDGKGAVHVGGGERFVFKHLSAGKHTLAVHVYGVVVAERTVELAAGEVRTLDAIELDAATFQRPRVFQAE